GCGPASATGRPAAAPPAARDAYGSQSAQKAALAVPTATGKRFRVGGADVGRLQLRQREASQQRRDVLAAKLGVAFVRPGRHLALHVLDPALKENRDGHPRRIDAGAVLQFRDQARGLYLRLSLRARKAMPAAPTLAGLRISHVDDDGPVAWGAFT